MKPTSAVAAWTLGLAVVMASRPGRADPAQSTATRAS